ncbi:FAS1 domain-containing protein [[Candida] jaroonii]|uniref:FAS1 domain-containing protein n=1 Tax=[Candida] jaroonii TaxID=467808 RepID=A0ACA9Y1C4_9ASCO|nr:FAS1 domain-containing protein [[Candida] jaroonii]
MKGIILFWLALTVVSKNVFDFNKFNLEAEKAERALKEDMEKRDGKNVFNLDDLKIGVPVKRDGKNVFDFSKFKNEKRDAKNVFDFSKFKNEKRDAKNVVDISKLAHGIDKRDQQVLQQDESTNSNEQLLTTVLPQYKSISIFSGYIRDNKAISDKTGNLKESMLIICPTDNSIVNKLGDLKPWEFPKTLNGENDDEIIESNLNYFLSNHIVENLQELKANDNKFTVELLSGKEIVVSQNFNGIELLADGVKIPVILSKQVDNGFIFIIDDCLVKP